ncbi:MAG: A24 family peptidase [Gemmataceae bacterium]|nr:A24 family peptidase [Gemmataceae bacterium]MDW8264903.1 A24 family peptidase [Gemmataceae bacterium]
MPPAAFFPDPVLAWVCYLILILFLSVASYVDLKRLIVPKWVTLPLLGLGLLLNVVRGAWLGSLGATVWVFEPEAWLTWHLEPGSWLAGAGVGALFSVAGFLFGFTVFFILWILGTCGGGDVKLFAALGAWVGPKYGFYVLIATLFLVLGISMLRLTYHVLAGGTQAATRDFSRKAGSKGEPFGMQPRRRLLSFSLPVALATALVLLWVFRGDLQLVPVRDQAMVERTSHAR